jgi:hypothetical protein
MLKLYISIILFVIIDFMLISYKNIVFLYINTIIKFVILLYIKKFHILLILYIFIQINVIIKIYILDRKNINKIVNLVDSYN